MEWVKVTDRLPVIPKDKYGIPVLVAEFDPCYDECSSIPNNGYSVNCISYNIVSYSHMPEFVGSIYADGEPAFMTMAIGGHKNGYEWIPVTDEVTHWMYMPKPPEYDPEVLNPIFKWYHENARPESSLKVL
jgi:hypothetical protein